MVENKHPALNGGGVGISKCGEKIKVQNSLRNKQIFERFPIECNEITAAELGK